MICSISEIGKRIAALRNARGLTQENFAKELNVSREVVAKWENGTRDLKTEHTIALAEYFDVTCDEILRGRPAENIDIHKRFGLSNDAILALEDYKNIPVGLEIINFLLASDTFSEFVDTLYSRQFLVCYLSDARRRKEALAEPLRTAGRTDSDDLKQVPITKIRGLAEQIMEEYAAQQNPEATKHIESILNFHNQKDSINRRKQFLKENQAAEDGGDDGEHN